MSNEALIRETVESYVRANQPFTSVDISNKIKTEKDKFVRNIEVRDWLHKNLNDDDLLIDYTTSPISVMNGTRTATLYHPNWLTADDYKNRDQHALTPAEMAALKNKTPAKTVVDIVNMVDKKGTSSRVIKSLERIKIPGVFIRKLGYTPGDTIDPMKIKTHSPIPTRLVVNKDYRLSIPRSSVNWGKDPVKVIFNKDHIAFERA